MLGPDTAPLMLLSPLWLPLPATLGLLPDPDPVCIVWIQPVLVTVYSVTLVTVYSVTL